MLGELSLIKHSATTTNHVPSSRFYGFCIDVLERISKIIGFNYILDLVQDKKVSCSTN